MDDTHPLDNRDGEGRITARTLLDELRVQLEKTGAQLGEFRDKLQPVLLPGDETAQAPTSPAVHAVERPRVDSPLVEQLSGYVSLVHVLQSHLADLDSRLQL